jgi:hypothetical protein
VSTEALALATISIVRPTTAAAVWAMLTGGRPRRLLTVYLLAGMGVSLTVGIGVVLLAGGTFLPRPPPGVRGVVLIILGVCALIGAVAVPLGWMRRFRPDRPGAPREARRFSPAEAATAGVVTHLPGVFYLAGLSAIAATGAAAAGAIAQVVVYNLVWFAPALAALGICLFGTIPSGHRLAGAVRWAREHQVPVLTVCFAGVGLWLLVEGFGDLDAG